MQDVSTALMRARAFIEHSKASVDEDVGEFGFSNMANVAMIAHRMAATAHANTHARDSAPAPAPSPSAAPAPAPAPALEVVAEPKPDMRALLLAGAGGGGSIFAAKSDVAPHGSSEAAESHAAYSFAGLGYSASAAGGYGAPGGLAARSRQLRAMRGFAPDARSPAQSVFGAQSFVGFAPTTRGEGSPASPPGDLRSRAQRLRDEKSSPSSWLSPGTPASAESPYARRFGSAAGGSVSSWRAASPSRFHGDGVAESQSVRMRAYNLLQQKKGLVPKATAGDSGPQTPNGAEGTARARSPARMEARSPVAERSVVSEAPSQLRSVLPEAPLQLRSVLPEAPSQLRSVASEAPSQSVLVKFRSVAPTPQPARTEPRSPGRRRSLVAEESSQPADATFRSAATRLQEATAAITPAAGTPLSLAATAFSARRAARSSGAQRAAMSQEDETTKQTLSELKAAFKAERIDLYEAFRRFDEDGNHKLDKHEFRSGLRGCGISLTEKQIDILMRTMDEDGDGKVDYFEFAKQFGVPPTKAATQKLVWKATERSAEKRKKLADRKPRAKTGVDSAEDFLEKLRSISSQPPEPRSRGKEDKTPERRSRGTEDKTPEPRSRNTARARSATRERSAAPTEEPETAAAAAVETKSTANDREDGPSTPPPADKSTRTAEGASASRRGRSKSMADRVKLLAAAREETSAKRRAASPAPSASSTAQRDTADTKLQRDRAKTPDRPRSKSVLKERAAKMQEERAKKGGAQKK